jgi:hypothetical protein
LELSNAHHLRQPGDIGRDPPRLIACSLHFDLRQANLVDLDQARPVQSMLTLFYDLVHIPLPLERGKMFTVTLPMT